MSPAFAQLGPGIKFASQVCALPLTRIEPQPFYAWANALPIEQHHPGLVTEPLIPVHVGQIIERAVLFQLQLLVCSSPHWVSILVNTLIIRHCGKCINFIWLQYNLLQPPGNLCIKFNLSRPLLKHCLHFGAIQVKQNPWIKSRGVQQKWLKKQQHMENRNTVPGKAWGRH